MSAKENHFVLEYKSQNTKWNQPTQSNAQLLHVSKERKVFKAQFSDYYSIRQLDLVFFFFHSIVFCSEDQKSLLSSSGLNDYEEENEEDDAEKWNEMDFEVIER